MSVSQPAGEPMVTPQRTRMSWEDYLALPEKPKAEWVDGEVVVTPPVSFDHGVGAIRLASLVDAVFPELYVVTEVGLWLPRNRLRAPDVMVIDARPDGAWVTVPPLLVAEVLSPSTRSEDTVRKATEYLEGGVGQYWIVDPELRLIDVYAAVDGAWEPLLHLDDDSPTGEVTVGDHGTVRVDLSELLPRRTTREEA